MDTLAQIVEKEEIRRRQKLLKYPHVFTMMIRNCSGLEAATFLAVVLGYDLRKINYIVKAVKEDGVQFESAELAYTLLNQ